MAVKIISGMGGLRNFNILVMYYIDLEGNEIEHFFNIIYTLTSFNTVEFEAISWLLPPFHNVRYGINYRGY